MRRESTQALSPTVPAAGPHTMPPFVPAADAPRHILLLTDRDWTHPEGGGTGTVLFGLVSRWIAWGHRVTVVAGEYPGAERVSHLHERLAVHRMGTRLTVFPRAAWATLRSVGEDADVVLEVCNGIAFNTSLWPWLRKPRTLLVFHVHQDHYVTELGTIGRIAAVLLEKVPLRHLYPGVPVVTISQDSREQLVELGIDADRVHVVYLGLDQGALRPAEKADHPTLVYLGRLKQYKRIERVLDALEGIPDATLDIAGDGDHREALEAEVDARGLRDRVTFHGRVSEEQKAALLGRAWLAMTASSAEGWCLTVIEAGACRTPTAAVRVGGLAEAIVHERTGLLADTPEELVAGVRELLADRPRLEAYSDAALERARTFTWDTTAEGTLGVMERAAAARSRLRLRDAVARSESGKAAGLAAATLLNNAIQLVFVLVFTRLLGATGYGSLAALVSSFLVLMVAGQSVQVAAAREAALDRLGDAALLRRTLQAWTERLLIALVAATAAGILLREPLAALIGVPEHPWGAAAIAPTGVLWMLVCLQRGVLQGMSAYGSVGLSIVGEALGRLACGLLLVGLGLDVVGAFLGTPLAFAVTAVALEIAILRRVGRVHRSRTPARSLRGVIGDGWVAILGLLLLAALQNVDVIVAKRELPGDAAGSYAAAAVAAKSVVWVAIGLGLQLLPEATRRAAAGLDPRPVLARALAVLAVLAVPALLIFTFAAEPLLRIAFGPELTLAAGALPLLGVAMTLLAAAYLTVQYMLALHRVSFLWVLAVVAVLEPVLLSNRELGVTAFAGIVLAIQAVVAAGMLVFGMRARRARTVAATT
jgi:glycosyltransferase involved in cell wall biosynthesis/O-antigen/teichoic acid export membrane protein